MSSCDDDRSEFERAMEGVRKSAPGKRRPEPAPELPAAPLPKEAPASFRIERGGERLAGFADGFDRRRLKGLANGEIPPDRRIDLHGLEAAGAERAVREAIEALRASGERCLLVIHGRGLRSEDGPALKRALPGWLAAPPHGRSILAFTTASPGHGGPGASFVLLRASRGPRR